MTSCCRNIWRTLIFTHFNTKSQGGGLAMRDAAQPRKLGSKKGWGCRSLNYCSQEAAIKTHEEVLWFLGMQ